MTSLYKTTLGLLHAFNLRPKKRLGQNFLIDDKALQNIIAAAELSPSDRVLEIGSGLGVLTKELADRAGHVTAIDKDKDMIEIAKKVLAGCSNIDFKPADFLDFAPDSPFNKVVANVPYYITSPIIERLLENEGTATFSRRFPKLELIVLTIQKEVAERITASPGSRKFGSFSVFVQNRAEAKIGAFISKNSFYPAPDVDSAILILKPYGKLLYNIDEKIVRAAFQQRRKMIRSSLAEFNIDFSSLGIDPCKRPESLSLEEFYKISLAR
ncbi:MAG: 16S rRNA (adenine(1518)-N(6)/adenine(1519)-N(6))-dimethyltransferase RsmA [Candidatus Margulisiibacteriota bacterium]